MARSAAAWMTAGEGKLHKYPLVPLRLPSRVRLGIVEPVGRVEGLEQGHDAVGSRVRVHFDEHDLGAGSLDKG